MSLVRKIKWAMVKYLVGQRLCILNARFDNGVLILDGELGLVGDTLFENYDREVLRNTRPTPDGNTFKMSA